MREHRQIGWQIDSGGGKPTEMSCPLTQCGVPGCQVTPFRFCQENTGELIPVRLSLCFIHALLCSCAAPTTEASGYCTLHIRMSGLLHIRMHYRTHLLYTYFTPVVHKLPANSLLSTSSSIALRSNVISLLSRVSVLASPFEFQFLIFIWAEYV